MRENGREAKGVHIETDPNRRVLGPQEGPKSWFPNGARGDFSSVGARASAVRPASLGSRHVNRLGAEPTRCMVGGAVAGGCSAVGGETEARERARVCDQAQGAGLGATHTAFERGRAVVVAGEVEPAVHDVEGEFGAEVAVVLVGEAGGSVGGDTDFAGESEFRPAGKSDDVGRAGVLEEVGVEAGEGAIGEEDEGELAAEEGGVTDGERSLGAVEGSDGGRDGALVEPEARVMVGDDAGARVHALASSADFSPVG